MVSLNDTPVFKTGALNHSTIYLQKTINSEYLDVYVPYYHLNEFVDHEREAHFEVDTPVGFHLFDDN